LPSAMVELSVPTFLLPSRSSNDAVRAPVENRVSVLQSKSLGVLEKIEMGGQNSICIEPAIRFFKRCRSSKKSMSDQRDDTHLELVYMCHSSLSSRCVSAALRSSILPISRRVLSISLMEDDR
jgi:hypothetical protein